MALDQRSERAQLLDGRITEFAEYGQHIPLTCVNHPEKRWSTKNISPIGARSIFYNLHSDPSMGPECSCPGSCLVSVLDRDWAAMLAEEEAQRNGAQR